MSNKIEDEKPRCLRSECFANYGDRCACLADNDFGDRDCPFYKSKRQLADERAALADKRRDAALRELRMDAFTGTHRIVR